jgi:flagellum-specific peptidoglycan hydrolase FlgJ
MTDPEAARFLAAGDGRTAAFAGSVEQDPRGRRLYNVQDWFATFATLGDCFARRAALFSAGRYAPLAAAYQAGGSLDDLVRGVAVIYATAPNYAESVLTLVHNSDVEASIAAARAESQP